MRLIQELLSLSRRVLAALCLVPLTTAPAAGEESGAAGSTLDRDKSRFNLLNPTPRHLLRELSADRPDKTESAFTVDAGHFQVELDFANSTYDRYNAEHTKTSSYEAAPMNLKVGLFNNLDAQVVFSPYRWLRTEDAAGHRVAQSGFGDVIPRLKLNLVGNDGGPFALALMPLVKLPTNQDHLGNRSVEGGVKAPFAFDVPEWDIAAQTEVEVIRDEAGSGYHPEWINSVSVGRTLVGKLSYYVEFFTNVSAEAHSDWVGTFDTWFTYQLNKDLRLDAGVYIGVTRAAEDWHPFAGMTVRF